MFSPGSFACLGEIWSRCASVKVCLREGAVSCLTWSWKPDWGNKGMEKGQTHMQKNWGRVECAYFNGGHLLCCTCVMYSAGEGLARRSPKGVSGLSLQSSQTADRTQ